MSSSTLDGPVVFARVARDLAEQPDRAHATQRITELAIQLTGCTTAAVWNLSANGHATLLAATNQQHLPALHEIRTGVEKGLAHEALNTRTTVHLNDVATEIRWPEYVTAIKNRRLPIASAVAYPLAVADRQLGALALYSSTAHTFTDDLIDLGAVLADHAAIALDAVTATDQCTNLRIALQTNRRIGTAIGILMALHRIDEQAAFDMLRVASQHAHLKIRDVADEVILTGATPPWTSRQQAVA